jgi:hypothetical protein
VIDGGTALRTGCRGLDGGNNDLDGGDVADLAVTVLEVVEWLAWVRTEVLSHPFLRGEERGS